MQTATAGRDTMMTREECSRWLCGIVGTPGGVAVSTLRTLESRGGVSPVILGGPPKYDARARFAALIGSRLLSLGAGADHLDGLGRRIAEKWQSMAEHPVPWSLTVEPGAIRLQSGDVLEVPRGSASSSPVVYHFSNADRLFRRSLAA